MIRALAAFSAACIVVGAPCSAATPREVLIQAAFRTPDKHTAVALVDRAIAMAQRQIAADPGNREALMQHAAGIGYRGKLTRNLGDAKTSRRLFEALAKTNPRDPEIQLLLAGWHLDAIADVGAFLAGAVIGAHSGKGLAALDRSVALGQGRAFFPGFAAMMRIRQDKDDIARARMLAEAALVGDVPTMLDRIARRDAEALLVPLRAGDGKAAAALARRLLPFGDLAR